MVVATRSSHLSCCAWLVSSTKHPGCVAGALQLNRHFAETGTLPQRLPEVAGPSATPPPPAKMSPGERKNRELHNWQAGFSLLYALVYKNNKYFNSCTFFPCSRSGVHPSGHLPSKNLTCHAELSQEDCRASLSPSITWAQAVSPHGKVTAGSQHSPGVPSHPSELPCHRESRAKRNRSAGQDASHAGNSLAGEPGGDAEGGAEVPGQI